uniref:Uncharacterized protein n=1 Tax=Laticauda laticaudata TaxID=8630 RepID=A0A8C5SEJ6_LATLA
MSQLIALEEGLVWPATASHVVGSGLVHLNSERKIRLHEGVYRDLERQKYKEHFNLLDKHTTLAIQLETENSKMLMTRKPQA